MKVVVFGLGRTGLPFSLVCADSNFEVFGIDTNEELVQQIKNGELPFYEPGLKELIDKYLNKKFFPTITLTDKIKNSDYYIVTINTKFCKYPKKISLTNLYRVVNQIIKIGVQGKTVIFRATFPIGTTDIIKVKLEKDGLKDGKNFYLAFVPERLMEGKAIEEEKNQPKIIGCYNDKSYQKVKIFFERIGGEIIRVSNPKTAEFIKLIDNSWRNTQFAFANDLAFLSEINGINVMETITAANQKYERNSIPIPGPVSGYCLGKDPYLLEYSFNKHTLQRHFKSVWFNARRTNDWLYEKIVKEVKGKNVLIVGLSYKADIDDYRNSHSIDIINLLHIKGFSIFVTDPHLDKNIYTNLPPDLVKLVKKCNFYEGVKMADTIIITTPHKKYRTLNLSQLKKSVKPGVKIIDLWNIYQGKLEKNKTIEYHGLGRGDRLSKP